MSTSLITVDHLVWCSGCSPRFATVKLLSSSLHSVPFGKKSLCVAHTLGMEICVSPPWVSQDFTRFSVHGLSSQQYYLYWIMSNLVQEMCVQINWSMSTIVSQCILTCLCMFYFLSFIVYIINTFGFETTNKDTWLNS